LEKGHSLEWGQNGILGYWKGDAQLNRLTTIFLRNRGAHYWKRFWNLKKILGFIIIRRDVLVKGAILHSLPQVESRKMPLSVNRWQRRTAVFAGYQEYCMGKENKPREMNIPSV